jgi:short-subunit dehydrogenase
MGEIVLITGCSSGIGKAFVNEFSKKGFKVIATARKPEVIENAFSQDVIVKKLDVTNEPDILALRQFAEDENLVPNILINNAGFGLMGPEIELPIESIRKQFETNVFGSINIIQKFVPLMINRGKGLIVNISSISGIMPTPFASAYCASKAALTAFSDSLRMELSPFGINVTIVQPGAITSKFGENAEKEMSNILKENSFYSKYKEAIFNRAGASQKDSTPAEKFVKKVVKKITRKNPPAIIRAGKLSKLVPILKKYLPTKTLDYILKRQFGL